MATKPLLRQIETLQSNLRESSKVQEQVLSQKLKADLFQERQTPTGALSLPNHATPDLLQQ